MVKLEGTWTGRATSPTEYELADPIAQLGAEYISLLREAHSTYKAWEPTEEERKKVEDTITRIKAAIPEINEEVLRKMVFENPNNIQANRAANRNWAVSGTAPYDIAEFHILAMNWENAVHSGNRKIAEEYYGVTKVEVDFLKRGAYILPPPPPLFPSVWSVNSGDTPLDPDINPLE